MKNIWGRDKEIKMTYGEKVGIWVALLVAFSLGVAVGVHF